jgi:hypothetical protein
LSTSRAQQYGVDFYGDRASLQQFLSVLSGLNEDLFYLPSIIQLFNQVLEIMHSIILTESEEDRECYLEFLVIIMRNWKLTENNMKDINYFHTAIETSCKLIEYIVYPDDFLQKEMVLTSLVIEKILTLVEFALTRVNDLNDHIEIFFNFLHHFLLSMEDLPCCKVQLLNLFFKLKGYDLLNRVIQNSNNPIAIKELQWILSEIMTHFTALLQDFNDSIKMNDLRKVFIKMFLNRNADDNMMKILSSYVDLKLSLNEIKDQLLPISEIIVKLSAEHVELDSCFLVMLVTIFTECFDSYETGNSQRISHVTKASSLLKNNFMCVTPEINENFIKWWQQKNISKHEERDKLIIKYISRDVFEGKSAPLYDLKLLAKLYFDENTAKTTRINILQIFTQSRLRMVEIKKLLTRLQKCVRNEIQFEASEILDVLSFNSFHYNLQGCNTVAPCVDRVFDSRMKNIDMRYRAIHLGQCLLLQIIGHFKKLNKKLSFD